MADSNTNYRDPNRGFRQWHRDEIVTTEGDGHWIPNPKDLVFDPTQGWFLVTEVDYTTGYSTLERWTPPATVEPEAGLDVLLGSGPGYPSESYRMFLDTSVTPHTLSPEARLYLRGSMIQYYKVFLGTDISQTYGKVISAHFDPSGNFLGTAIPVETVPVYDNEGVLIPQDTIKVPADGYTSETLANGEIVTLVGYSADGHQKSEARLVVVNTAAARHVDASKRYVQSVAIDSPFLSDADPQTIEFPLNVAVRSLPLTAVVHYSDGSKQAYPVDGNKFSLMGLNNYVATVPGQQFDLTLAYNLSPDEVSYNMTPTPNRRLVVDYYALTTSPDGAYEVKLYVYPVWHNSATGYRLEYWLYNLDRQTFYNVTPQIELGANSAPFDGLAYGANQTVTVAVDLNRVDGMFSPYRHVQTFQVALLGRGDEDTLRWEVRFRPDQDAAYGRGLEATVEYVNTNYWKLRLGNDLPSKEVWLKTLYEGVEPLVNTESEGVAPTPTHVRIIFLNNQYEISVDQWNDEIVVNNDLSDGELVYLQWIKRTAETDLQLAITGVPIRTLAD